MKNQTNDEEVVGPVLRTSESPKLDPESVSDRMQDCIDRCRETGGRCCEPDTSIKTPPWLFKYTFVFILLMITLLVAAALYGYLVQGRELEDGLLGPVTQSLSHMVRFIFDIPSE